VFVATAVVLGVELARGRRQLVAEAQAGLTARAGLVADRLRRSVRERQRLLAVWPELESSRDLAVDDVDKRLAASLRQLAANFAEPTVALGLNPRGEVIAASDPAWLGDRLPGAWRAAAGLATQLLADSVPGPWTGAPRLVVAAPVRDPASGRRLGTIVLATPWRQLVTGAAAGLPDAVLVRDDAGGQVVVDPRPDSARTGPPLRGRTLALALGGPNVYVTNAEPRTEALVSLRDTRRRLLLLALVVLAITAPAAALVAGGTTRALDRLTRAALAVRRADPRDLPSFGQVPTGAPREVHVLAGALQEMVERLERSRHELARQESLASVGAMAAVLAHEIRTPLAVLRGSADMLQKRLADDARGRELVALLQEETDRLSRLASDLLGFARPRPPERAPADLADVAARAASMLLDRYRGADVQLEVATTPAPVRADAEQLGQAALNLLGNALEVSRAGTHVRLETGAAAGKAWLRVADEGPGIPPENLERIWLPFFTTRRGGTGLGLPIVRQIVEAHGGHAEVETSPAGTRISLVLPQELTP
jgi:signal transduction histidine kinase